MNWKTQLPLLAASIVLSASVASGADVAENWKKHCTSCHAADGSGNTAMGRKSGAENYQDPKVQAKFTDAEAIEVITNGKKKMKGYKDKLSEDEIKALVAHVRSFKK